MRYKKDDFVGVRNTNPQKFVKITGIITDSSDDDKVLYVVFYPDGSKDELSGYQLDSGNKIGAWQPSTPARFLNLVETGASHVYIPEKMKVSLPRNKYRLLFRGDDRLPESIFEEGFKPREEHFAPIFRGLDSKEYKAQFDIAPQTGVNASPRPEVGALFPLKLKWDDSKEHTNLYAFYVKEYFSTYTIQKQAAKEGRLVHRDDVQHAIRTKLFAKEVAVGKEGIPGIQIIGCWPVRRWWLGKDWTVGTVYMVGKFIENPNNWLRVIKRNTYAEFLTRIELQVRRMPHHYSPEDVK